jgi:hypothetical protein
VYWQIKLTINFIQVVPESANSRSMRISRAKKHPADFALPPPGYKRWTAQRKAAVVFAVRLGSLSREGALQAYSISEEELATWEDRFEVDGLGGLQHKHKPPTYRQLPVR